MMNARSPRTLRRAIALAAMTAAGVLALAGCKLPGADAPGAPAGAASPTSSAPSSPGGASTAPRKPSPSGTASAIPEVCALLSRAEVTALTGKQITQVDADHAKPGDTVRFCQWQLSGARLVITLSPTTKAQFNQRGPEATKVTGVGDDAYTLGGHLFILHGAIMVDIYASSGGDAAADLGLAKNTAAKVLPRI